MDKLSSALHYLPTLSPEKKQEEIPLNSYHPSAKQLYMECRNVNQSI